MSQENVEVVKVADEVFAREGLDRFMEHFADDVEYHVLAGADDLIHGPIHGKDAVRAWLLDWIDMFESFWMELAELTDAGGATVFTAERYGGRARLSGIETDSANWTVFSIRDGKIAGGREYETREAALEAAGLRE